jgi:hypothetical protein
MESLPFSLWMLVAVGVLGIAATTALALYRGAGPRPAATRLAVLVGGGWLIWIVVSAVLAGSGAYRQSTTQTRPWIGVAAGAALAVALLAARHPAVRRTLTDPGADARLTWPHTFRVVGVVFGIAMLLGKLPAVFAVPAGLGDIAVGLAAPFIARRLARGDRRGAVLFHTLGLVDLLVAVSIGFLAALGPARLLDVSPSTQSIALLPLVLVPTTAVPLLIGLHLVSLARFRAGRPTTAGAGPVRLPATPVS